MVIFPSLLAYLCFNRGVALIGPNRAAPFLHLMPLFGSVLAILLLGEKFELFHLAERYELSVLEVPVRVEATWTDQGLHLRLTNEGTSELAVDPASFRYGSARDVTVTTAPTR